MRIGITVFALFFVASLSATSLERPPELKETVAAHWDSVVRNPASTGLTIHICGPAGLDSTERALIQASSAVRSQMVVIAIAPARFLHPCSCLEQIHLRATTSDGGVRTEVNDPAYRGAIARHLWTLSHETAAGHVLPIRSFPFALTAAYDILDRIRDDLVTRFGIEAIGVTTRMRDRIRVVGLDFLVRQPTSLDSAHTMAIQCAEALLEALNGDDFLSSRLDNVTFTEHNLELAISYLNPDESRVCSLLAECVAVSCGHLQTFYVHPETGDYQKVDQEPYAVARSRYGV